MRPNFWVASNTGSIGSLCSGERQHVERVSVDNPGCFRECSVDAQDALFLPVKTWDHSARHPLWISPDTMVSGSISQCCFDPLKRGEI